ncbi:MAG TPA: hypothetical protein VKF40_29610 [Burkholderiales bacterium]|nr:hypothetical protein [Burkholderiales bacterium]
MSGPITVVIVAEPIAALLSAAAIRAAHAIRQGYEQAAELREEHAALQEAQRAAQSAARQQGAQALETEVAAAEARFDQLIALSEKLGAAVRVKATRPVRPATGDPMALAAYARGLQALAGDLQAILLTEAARQREALEPEEAGIAIPEAASREVASRPSERLLSRIAHLGPPPEDIEKLARELDGTGPGDRADLLATELRRRIQSHLERTQRRLVQEATATIVRQSLEDLGYEVEDIADTLVVEGGMVHFRRRDWGDYMVRLRVDAATGEANFNVVRAVDAGVSERSVLDHIAEDRWCAEFPALLKTLEARGVRLDVTRRLAAGELPVQLVERRKLPKFAQEESGAPIARLLGRKIK